MVQSLNAVVCRLASAGQKKTPRLRRPITASLPTGETIGNFDLPNVDEEQAPCGVALAVDHVTGGDPQARSREAKTREQLFDGSQI
jgi:hypothetical protein